MIKIYINQLINIYLSEGTLKAWTFQILLGHLIYVLINIYMSVTLQYIYSKK
jgi:hypothetical protein